MGAEELPAPACVGSIALLYPAPRHDSALRRAHRLRAQGRLQRGLVADYPGPEAALCSSSLKKMSLSSTLATSRFIIAMDEVSGISLGHTFTQFWALPQSWIPPGPISARVRSSEFIFPVGFILNRRAWLMAAAPTK